MVAYDGSASKRIARKECRKNVAYIHDSPVCGNARISGNSDELEINDKVMDDIAEKVGGEFYILPSSVHELLIIPRNADTDLKSLESMVQEVNATQVAPEERLSDHVYAYDTKEHELFRADKAEERAAAKESSREENTAAVKENEAGAKAKVKEEKQERPSLKARLAEKKDMAAKAEANREPRQMNKKKDMALA